MGLEKNSDAVAMECYAPLLVNVSPADTAKGYPKAWQWNTNLIGYDALRSFGSPSYYAQVMLAQNKGDVVLPLKLDAPAASDSVFATSTLDKANRIVIVKVVNAGIAPFETTVKVRGVDRVEPTATARGAGRRSHGRQHPRRAPEGRAEAGDGRWGIGILPTHLPAAFAHDPTAQDVRRTHRERTGRPGTRSSGRTCRTRRSFASATPTT